MSKTPTTPKAQTASTARSRPKGPTAAKVQAVASTKAKPKSKPGPVATRSVADVAAPAAGATKLQTMIDLLSRPHGASVEDLMAATGWQAHSVRGAIAGALKKKGIAVTSKKVDGRRSYHIAKPGRV